MARGFNYSAGERKPTKPFWGSGIDADWVKLQADEAGFGKVPKKDIAGIISESERRFLEVAVGSKNGIIQMANGKKYDLKQPFTADLFKNDILDGVLEEKYNANKYSASEGAKAFIKTPTDELRTKAYEAEGMTRSDAQSAVEAENQTWKDGKPPLGAKGFTPNPDDRYAERNGARAFLGYGKSTQEIKKMIVSDFKSKEALKFGITGVAKATASRKSIRLTLKTNLDQASSNIREEREKVQDDARRIAMAYDVDRSDIGTDYFDKRYYLDITLLDKDGNDIVR